MARKNLLPMVRGDQHREGSRVAFKVTLGDETVWSTTAEVGDLSTIRAAQKKMASLIQHYAKKGYR